MKDVLERHYQSLEKLGEGGMGEVWKGLNPMLEREEAIKVLKPELSSRKDFVERFRTEAIALARLNHPNIVAVYSCVQEASVMWMALEYARGHTLDQLLVQKVTWPWKDAARLIVQVLDGLECAHAAGIVHRDLKPANVILTPTGLVKIMDFGIARIAQSVRLTQVGHMVGTLEYMSPEQIQGQEATAASDFYSLGIMFYELLTGSVPFSANTDYAMIQAQISQVPVSPSKRVDGLPKEVERIVLKALSKKPEDRYASAKEFRQALHDVLNGSDQERGKKNIGAPEALQAANKRSKLVIGLGASMAVVGVGLIGSALLLRPADPAKNVLPAEQNTPPVMPAQSVAVEPTTPIVPAKETDTSALALQPVPQTTPNPIQGPDPSLLSIEEEPPKKEPPKKEPEERERPRSQKPPTATARVTRPPTNTGQETVSVAAAAAQKARCDALLSASRSALSTNAYDAAMLQAKSAEAEGCAGASMAYSSARRAKDEAMKIRIE